MVRASLVLIVLTSALALGESQPSSILTSSKQEEVRVIGSLELRPSFKNRGAFHTEDSVVLGAQLDPKTTLVYKQELNSNLFDPTNSQNGVNLYAYDGYFRERSNDIWKDDSGHSISLESRIYLPTFSVKRDAGMLTTLRQYVKFKKWITPSFNVSFEEVPMFHLYSRAGFNNAANPWFENREYVSAEYIFTKTVRLFFPFIISHSRYREFGETAKYNSSWQHKVYFHPELTYAVTPNTMVGLAYYSDNLLTPEFKTWILGEALNKGVTQVIMQASL